MDEWDVLTDFTSYPMTDIGSSKLFADIYKDRLKFVRELGLYFFYNGKTWEKDLNSVYAKRLAKKFAIKAVEHANKIENEQAREAAIKYYAKFNGFNQREKLIKDAQSVYVIDYSDFDSHPELYNCQNGTFNLLTGELYEHNSEDMLTQISNVYYDANASCKRWERFIDEEKAAEYETKAKEIQARNEKPELEDIADSLNLTQEYSAECIAEIDRVFGENTVKKYFYALYEAIPDFVPDVEYFMDFIEKITPIVKEIYAKHI